MGPIRRAIIRALLPKRPPVDPLEAWAMCAMAIDHDARHMEHALRVFAVPALQWAACEDHPEFLEALTRYEREAQLFGDKSTKLGDWDRVCLARAAVVKLYLEAAK